MTAEVYIAGERVDIVSGLTIRRSISSIIGSCTFSTPLNLLAHAEAHAEVAVYRNGTAWFRGKIDTHSLQYSGRALSLSLTCSDGLSSLATAERLSFASGTSAGAAIESLLSGTGISASGVGLRSTSLPSDCLVAPLGASRLDQVQKIVSRTGAVVYLAFEGQAVAKCDTWSVVSGQSQFTDAISVSDATHLIISFSLDPAPEAGGYARASIKMVGTPAQIYNILNLAGLYADMGVSISPTTWRVTEATVAFNENGPITTATLIQTDADLSTAAAARAGGEYDPTEQIRTETDTIVSNSLGRLASVTGTGTGTATVEYDTGESETVVGE